MTDLSGWIMFLALAILATFFVLGFTLWYSIKFSEQSRGRSPYTGMPLRRAKELSYYSMERIILFLNSFGEYDNRPFYFRKSAFCRDTGRIFPKCITWLDTIKLDWTFLQKRYPGTWVSWGSLNDVQQQAIREAHFSLEGFQTSQSSPSPAPRAIEPEYVYTIPGPLYVDLQTKTLLGWKMVPDTEFEVLIVQKPKRM